jgi:hypothetical protein
MNSFVLFCFFNKVAEFFSDLVFARLHKALCEEVDEDTECEEVQADQDVEYIDDPRLKIGRR